MTSEEKENSQPLRAAGDDTPGRLSREEMLDQLGVMARQIATDAPPVIREASVVVAELTAIAARNTGPIAHVIADATDDASLRLAQRLEDYAASVRLEDGTVQEDGTVLEDGQAGEDAGDAEAQDPDAVESSPPT